MVYATTGIPVGAYQPTRLSALGIGHWAADAGAGYTYLNEQAGFEWSVVAGITYNFINPYTHYQSGTDAHLDWAISPYLSEKMHVGAVGYVYNQLSGDSGPGARLGEFKSRVAGIGPRSGSFFRLRTGKDTSISEATTSSTQGTGSKAGTRGLHFPLSRRRSRQTRSGSNKHPPPRAIASRDGSNGLHPPSAIATPTSAPPTATIEMPMPHGRSPAQCPNA